MKIGKAGALVVGVLTVLPFVWMMVFFLGFIAMFVSNFTGGTGQTHGGPPFWFLLFFLLHLGAMLLVLGLVVFYIVHLFKTEAVPNDKKALWAVVLFFGNLFAMPVYWFLYIWRPLRIGQEATAAPGTA